MVCRGLNTAIDIGIEGILQYPTTCDTYFYAKIMAAFFIVVTFTLFQSERNRLGRSDMISAMGVGALATIFVSLIGTLVTIIQPDIFIQIFVVGMIFIVLWMLKK